jgi:chemotaxis protein histidine kinase CheA
MTNTNSIQNRIQLKKINYSLFDELNKVIRLKHIFKNHRENSKKASKNILLEKFYAELQKASDDFSKQLNKKIDLKIVNTINNVKFIDLIKFPIIQLLKNSISYGIEEEIERIAKNKKETGRILIKMFEDKKCYCIEVIDDGKGIDVDMARKKVASLKLNNLNDVNNDSNLLLNYIFSSKYKNFGKPKELVCYENGFSLILNTINRFDGKISISTKKDIGTKFFLKIPEKNISINNSVFKQLKN